MNTNCLEHIACPQCGNDSALNITVIALAHVTDDGAEVFGDLEWDDQSFAACPACGRIGKLGEFHYPCAPASQMEAGSMNTKRAAWASAALASFCWMTGQHDEEEMGEAIGDLICDLLHLAKAKNLNPEALVTQAIAHYEHEILFPDD